MVQEAAIAEKNIYNQDRMAAAARGIVKDGELLERLETTQQAHRDPLWQDSEHKAVLADIMEHLLAEYGAAPTTSDEDKRHVSNFAAALASPGENHASAPDADEQTSPAPPEQGDDQPPVLPSVAVLDTDLADLLHGAGYLDVGSVVAAPDEDLLAIKGIGPAKLTEIREAVG